MNRAERQAEMETHPGVTRLKTPHQWSHLVHNGIWGDMDEYARTERWWKRRGREA